MQLPSHPGIVESHRNIMRAVERRWPTQLLLGRSWEHENTESLAAVAVELADADGSPEWQLQARMVGVFVTDANMAPSYGLIFERGQLDDPEKRLAAVSEFIRRANVMGMRHVPSERAVFVNSGVYPSEGTSQLGVIHDWELAKECPGGLLDFDGFQTGRQAFIEAYDPEV